ncbi:MAG: CotH kinase family protein [Oscillospiraceae bacterium]
MSTHKHIDRICVAAVILSLLLTILFMNGEALGLQSSGKVTGYENRLFDISTVHTIDIVMDDWDSFIETCESEEYSICTVVIDGESCKNVGIRGKGNTSLSSVSSMGSDRYSFKIEFDHYDSTKSYHGLDKLSLNNIIQDNTYMKDYLTYRMMYEFGVDAPLCNFVYITVNGEDWGLYLAVEGVEEAFLQRNYGSGYGELYKPDSTSFGGGRGNGMNFDMEDFSDQAENSNDGSTDLRGGWENSFVSGEMSGGGSGYGSSSDVKLQYIDDDPYSYANIFGNAKTDVSEADKQRLIASLKSLSAYEDLERVLNIDEVLRYFVVHNFVVNGDSYTGSMIHNYYLYEEDGRLSMIPWDYNLAFGTFSGGNATASVNDAIDDVLTDRPMQAWIFSDETYTQMYHELYQEFLDSVDISGIIEEAYTLIAPYVEKDPSKFCTYEEFESGVEALLSFCRLRSESVQGQLDGSIPSTSEGQNSDSSSLVNADDLSLSAMGTMNSNGFGGSPGSFGGERGREMASMDPQGDQAQQEVLDAFGAQAGQPEEPSSGPSGTERPSGEMKLPEGADPSSMADGSGPDAASGNMPGGQRMSQEESTNSDGQAVSDSSSGPAPVLLGISMLFLIGGLVFALKCKR